MGKGKRVRKPVNYSNTRLCSSVTCLFSIDVLIILCIKILILKTRTTIPSILKTASRNQKKVGIDYEHVPLRLILQEIVDEFDGEERAQGAKKSTETSQTVVKSMNHMAISHPSRLIAMDSHFVNGLRSIELSCALGYVRNGRKS